MKLQTIILSLLAAGFVGVVTYPVERWVGLRLARWVSAIAALIVFGLSVWLRN